MSKPTYLDCIQELIKAGYLVKTDGNNYNFYEDIPEVEEINVTVKKCEES